MSVLVSEHDTYVAKVRELFKEGEYVITLVSPGKYDIKCIKAIRDNYDYTVFAEPDRYGFNL